jgi:outer membrane biosynthesis protein TonB
VKRFELDPTKQCRTYSKGNRQKVVLIAALVSDVELFILDEPTPSPVPTPTPSPVPTPTPSPVPTPTPSPVPTPTPSPVLTPTPSPVPA